MLAASFLNHLDEATGGDREFTPDRVRLTGSSGADKLGVWAGEDPVVRGNGVDLWDGFPLTEGQLPLFCEWCGEGYHIECL